MARAEFDVQLGGRYELGELIGQGGMGEVRAGTDRRLGRPVAVKLLRPDLAGDPEIRARFEAEARAAAALSHPNVVAVFDTGEVDGQPFIVMELLSGETLADVIAEAPLSPDAARRMGRQMLAALQVAHNARICHRDVKPGNLLRADASNWKVADFGIAKSTEASVGLTTTGGLIGTPAYLAPERIDGRPATPASDIYSAGVVLYEALTGERPFQAENPVAVAHMIREREPAPLPSRCPDVDPALAEAVERAMAKDPVRRFPTAQEMSDALAEHGAETAPVDVESTAPASATRVLPAKSRPRPRLHPGWVAAVIGAAIAVIALLFALTRDSSDEPGLTEETTVTTVAIDSGGGGATLPESLDDALERLNETVQP